MGSMFQSLPERAAKLLNRFPFVASSSASSSWTVCSQVEAELRKLRRRMERIRALLSDAEEREIREESVRLWLSELRDVAYDSEDVLYKVEHEFLRHQLDWEEEERNSSPPHGHGVRGMERKREVGDAHVTSARRHPLSDASFQQQIVPKITGINKLLDEILSDGLALKLREEHGRGHGGEEPPPRTQQTSYFVDEQRVHGRDDDKRKVIDMLLAPDDASRHYRENVCAVSIVGMGGLGKTTLAQLVFNGDQVVNHFEPRMWVCVSDSFDVPRLTREILRSLDERLAESSSDFNFLQKSLHRKLQGKRFLLVLDDVWNESQSHWEALWVCLSSGAQGGRVLITTRNKTVSRISRVDPANMHQLGCLPEGDSWSLFEQRAFGGRSSGDHPELVRIGRKIVKRCQGLPLAVKTLAGLLFCEFREDRWMDILRSELWELPEDSSDILPALKLSYHHLPSPLKPCFAYCAVLQKDGTFNRDQLVRMWIAHGYIRPLPSTRRCMEDVGRGYVEELLQRSFFKPGIQITMHDLIHDLALSVWSKECCQVANGRLSSGKARHLVFDRWVDTVTLLFHEPIDNVKKWRTCRLPRAESTLHVAQVSKILNVMFLRMEYLLVLDLGEVFLRELPASVGNLKHLRYLGIGDVLAGLPESLGNLLNLQSIKIAGYYGLELPKRLKDLVNLRHLDIPADSHIPSLSMMPRGIGRLTQLRTLPLFVMGEGSGAAGIEELTGLYDLQDCLRIHVKSLDRWANRSAGDDCGGRHDNYRKESCCILKNKQGLDSLFLQFADREGESPAWAAVKQQHQEQESLLESLQPHTNIKRIAIYRYSGGSFPKWLGNSSYRRLEEINLLNCANCRHIPALGQLPSLKRLKMLYFDGVVSGGRGFSEAASFMSLEILELVGLLDCGSLSIGTERGGAFPCLRKLIIMRCPRMEHVKLRDLTALRELRIRDCNELSVLDYHDDEHMHIPGVHAMMLQYCQKLNFPLAQLRQQQQQLPPSLLIFDVRLCPLLSEWATSHSDELVGLFSFFLNHGPRQLVSMSLRNLWKETLAFDAAGVKKLELQWDDVQKQGLPSRPAEAELVLNKQMYLHSVTFLEELVIVGYQGRSFPAWVGDPNLLRRLIKLTLSGCVHCDRLPPLGLLPSLEQLHISRMPEVRRVGHEFCGSGGSGAAFRALRTLELSDMPQLEAWEDGAFPNLHVLRIDNCPNLKTVNLTFRPELESESLEWEDDCDSD